MSDLLDRTILAALDDIVAHAPPLGSTPDEFTVSSGEPSTRRMLAIAAAAVLLVGGAVAIAAVSGQRDRSPGTSATPSGSVPSPVAVELQPAASLPDDPDVFDVPVTGVGPTLSWYRLQPDLDVAWRTTSDGATELCWRTPADDACQPDGPREQLVLPTAGGQVLVVVVGDPGRTTLDVQLSDGTIRSAPLDWDDIISWGVARFELPAGVTVDAAGTGSAGDPEADAVTGVTLAPAVDLTDVPITVAAGGPLSYWRFLPDLDISERQTSTGGTELCWRTPVGTGCVDDTFESPDVGIIATDGAAIFLARAALVPIDPPPTDPLAPTMQLGPTPTTVTVTFSDGTTVDVTIRYGEQFGVGYARVDVPDGLTAATSS